MDHLCKNIIYHGNAFNFIGDFFSPFWCVDRLSKAWNCWTRKMINTIFQSSTLLLRYFVVFNAANTLNFKCWSNNQSEHNMVSYFQLNVSCLELFPSTPNAYFGWPNLFAKFSNTHFHMFDF